VTRKLEDDLRINDPLGDIGDDSVDEDWEDDGNGIRPMEPLQPSSKTKKKASRYSKRAENAKLSETVGAGQSSSLRAKRGNPGQQNIEDLERQMKEAAARLDFEEAARLRDIIRGMK
jgi:excinuclease ABC subunit B